eukprot:SAG22_NODE_403_length_11012_cov_12.141024_8_plen_108_part_00
MPWRCAQFFRTVEELPQKVAGQLRVVLIAARAPDFPAFFHASLARGVDAIYLEKPGAPDVPTMEKMTAAAAEAGVPVSMGCVASASVDSVASVVYLLLHLAALLHRI